ncbi:MAG: ComEC/Rec2 family competence protein [Paracoccaceae bacterium]
MAEQGALARSILAQRGHLFPWVPVCLALGIGLYFALRVEPAVSLLWLSAVLAAGLGLLAGRIGPVPGPFVWALALVAAGFGAAGLRAHLKAAPVLDFRYYGPIEGRVVGVDRSASDALRLTLDQVVLEDVRPVRVPARIRVALHGMQGFVEPRPGMRVILTGHLSPPQGPVEPGGFDFRRHAWFQGLGAVGYTRTPVLLLAPPDGAWHDLAVGRARMAISTRVLDALPGQSGAFATAVLTGDRSAMGQETIDALRDSNLAHLLAISGLHMGLLAGFVFAVLRLCLIALPRIGVRLPVKKIAATGALAAAACYLALSGGNVATERAFTMVAVVLVGVLFDRRALSLRSVALAATVLLLVQPESLLGPGFQMSFAATVALVAVFARMRDLQFQGIGPAWLRPAFAVAISSAVAGAATAPIGAAHFNQLAHYGLAANLAAVPLMGVLIMPAGVVAACLMPLGLEGIALFVMGLGLDWILAVAHFAAGLEGAVGHVPSPPAVVLPLFALGVLILILWQGRLRVAGLMPVLAALALWLGTERPALLVAEDGALVGAMTQSGRALSKPRGAGFVARVWLENDGDGATQEQAAARWARAALPIRHVWSKPDVAAFEGCRTGEIVILAGTLDGAASDCIVIDRALLERAGSLALYPRQGEVRLVSTAARHGRRLWSGVGPEQLPDRVVSLPEAVLARLDAAQSGPQ